MEDDESLYVSDSKKHEVRQYGDQDEKEGMLLTGGNGPGSDLNQLKNRRNICVDEDQSIYM